MTIEEEQEKKEIIIRSAKDIYYEGQEEEEEPYPESYPILDWSDAQHADKCLRCYTHKKWPINTTKLFFCKNCMKECERNSRDVV